MTQELLLLATSAGTIAFVHTLLGPDHYLPFVAMARARAWSTLKTLRITLLCGVGHIVGSVLLGTIGLIASVELASLEWIESIRGDLAAWCLVAVGLVYLAWGVRRAYRNKPHSHWHSHDGQLHCHIHTHHHDHSHAHTEVDQMDTEFKKPSIAPWALFVVFVLGPCEPLIPLLMFPAATNSVAGVFLVTGVFSLVTVLTMLTAVLFSLWGLSFVKLPSLERYSHAIAGSTILMCGFSIAVLGL